MSTLAKIKQNQIEMVRDRGYTIPADEIPLETITDKMDRSLLNQVYSHPRRGNLYVAYLPSPKDATIGVDVVRRLMTQLGKMVPIPKELMLISKEPLGAYTVDYLNNMQRSRDGSTMPVEPPNPVHPTDIQHFYDVDLTYNPVRHQLVPKHEVLTEEEAREFLYKNRLTLQQLPIITYTDIATRVKKARRPGAVTGDPVVNYYRWRQDQIIRIRRENFLTETLVDSLISYRRVW